MKINTKQLQERLKVLVKGAGLNPIKPLTQLIFLKSNLQSLTLMTTDSVNAFFTTVECEGDLEIAVEVQKFYKLIQSIKKETIEIEVDKDRLIIKGEGQYILPSVLDSQGNVITFKDRRKFFDGIQVQNIFSNIYKQLKPSKADSLFPIECYRNFYFGKKTITTNTLTASCVDLEVFNQPMLLPEKVVQILGMMKDVIKYEENHFTDGDFYVIVGRNQNIEDYQVDDILELFTPMTSYKVDTVYLKEILDRFTLFEYESLILKPDEIVSEKGDIKETLSLPIENTIKLDVKSLKQFVNTFNDMEIEISVSDEYVILKKDRLSHLLTKKV